MVFKIVGLALITMCGALQIAGMMAEHYEIQQTDKLKNYESGGTCIGRVCR